MVDPEIKGVLGSLNQPLLSASWYFSPGLAKHISREHIAFHCSFPDVGTVGVSGLSGVPAGQETANRGVSALAAGSSHLITLFVKVLGFYPVICSSNIQLKLQVENRLHTADHGFTSLCTTLTAVHTSV